MRYVSEALALCILVACGSESDRPGKAAAPVKIGREIYRGTLDGRGVLFFEASDTALSLAYDTLLCGLYSAWKGPVTGDSANIDGSYAAQGPLYRRQTASLLWTVRNAQGTVVAPARFRGWEEDTTGYVAFKYALALPKGDSIAVLEEPSFDDHYGDNALRRDFHLTGIPPGDTVRVLLGGGDLGRWPEKWELSGGGAFVDVSAAVALDISDDGVSSTKVRWEGSSSP